MRRRFITRASAVLQLLWVVVVVLWVRSYWRWSGVTLSLTRQVIGVSVQRGDILLIVDDKPHRAVSSFDWTITNEVPNPPAFEIRSSGFVHNYNNVTGASSTHVFVPIWFVVLAYSLLLTRPMFRRRRARDALRNSLCPNCGYNLTGNTSGVCPECGTAVKIGPN